MVNGKANGLTQAMNEWMNEWTGSYMGVQTCTHPKKMIHNWQILYSEHYVAKENTFMAVVINTSYIEKYFHY